MHIIMAHSAFDIPAFDISFSYRPRCAPQAQRMALYSASPDRHGGIRVLSTVVQGIMFSAVLWMLVAGPGFLSAEDSLVPSGAVRPAPQASR